MPSFSKSSQSKLKTCHLLLQKLFNEVIKEFDCTITCGERGEFEQNEAFRKGYSKLKYPQSKHNVVPPKEKAEATDAVPYPIDWKDTERMYYFGGFVKGKASAMGIKIRWGGDWDSDTQVKDQNFIDLPHFELIL